MCSKWSNVKQQRKRRERRLKLNNTVKKFKVMAKPTKRDKTGKIIPVVKKCLKCGKRVKFHHKICPCCWKEQQEREKDTV